MAARAPAPKSETRFCAPERIACAPVRCVERGDGDRMNCPHLAASGTGHPARKSQGKAAKLALPTDKRPSRKCRRYAASLEAVVPFGAWAADVAVDDAALPRAARIAAWTNGLPWNAPHAKLARPPPWPCNEVDPKRSATGRAPEASVNNVTAAGKQRSATLGGRSAHTTISCAFTAQPR